MSPFIPFQTVGTLVIAIVASAAALPREAPKPTDAQQHRHEQLQSDSAHLVELATQLKAEVDKSSKDTLSVPVVQKADEIAKLARKIRDPQKP
jgi:cell envelope opacity-associated protein A